MALALFGALAPPWTPTAAQHLVAAAETPAVRALATRGMRAEVAALIMSGQEGGTIPLEVLALPIVGEGEKARVPVLFEIDGAALLAGHDAMGTLRFEIYAYAIAESGGLQDYLLQTFEIDLERLETKLGDSGIKFQGELELRPGEYSLRVLVRNPKTLRVGLRVVPLIVPGGEEGKPVLSPPILADPDAAWLLLRQAEVAAEPGSPPAASVLAFLAMAALPSAKPVIAQDTPQPFYMMAYNLTSVGSEIVAELWDPSGRKIAEVPARVNGYSVAAAGGFRLLSASFDPGSVRGGTYNLRVALRGGDGGSLESAALPVVVVGGGRAPDLQAWIHVDPQAVAAAAPAPRAAPTKPITRRAARRQQRGNPAAKAAATAYAKALELLAKGEQSAAREAVLTLSTDLLSSQGDGALPILRGLERTTAERIAKADPESLEPVMMLHFWLYREARSQKNYLLSTHARTTALRLVGLYQEKSRSQQAAARAARFLTSLAGELQQGSMSRMSEGLFLRVLELDPTNEAALLAVAVKHEKHGDYEAAIGYLKDLVKAYPNHGEGRLRLAVNLARDMKGKASRRHLGQLLKGQHSTWVLVLAYEELASYNLRKNQLEEAEELLLAGIERLPGAGKLYIALAFVYDARQEPWRAQEVLAKMDRQARRDQESARHRYTRYPTEALAETRRLLISDATARLPDLSAALVSASLASPKPAAGG